MKPGRGLTAAFLAAATFVTVSCSTVDELLGEDVVQADETAFTGPVPLSKPAPEYKFIPIPKPEFYFGPDVKPDPDSELEISPEIAIDASIYGIKFRRHPVKCYDLDEELTAKAAHRTKLLADITGGSSVVIYDGAEWIVEILYTPGKLEPGSISDESYIQLAEALHMGRDLIDEVYLLTEETGCMLAKAGQNALIFKGRVQTTATDMDAAVSSNPGAYPGYDDEKLIQKLIERGYLDEDEAGGDKMGFETEEEEPRIEPGLGV